MPDDTSLSTHIGIDEFEYSIAINKFDRFTFFESSRRIIIGKDNFKLMAEMEKEIRSMYSEKIY